MRSVVFRSPWTRSAGHRRQVSLVAPCCVKLILMKNATAAPLPPHGIRLGLFARQTRVSTSSPVIHVEMRCVSVRACVCSLEGVHRLWETVISTSQLSSCKSLFTWWWVCINLHNLPKYYLVQNAQNPAPLQSKMNQYSGVQPLRYLFILICITHVKSITSVK